MDEYEVPFHSNVVSSLGAELIQIEIDAINRRSLGNYTVTSRSCSKEPLGVRSHSSKAARIVDVRVRVWLCRTMEHCCCREGDSGTPSGELWVNMSDLRHPLRSTVRATIVHR